MMRTQLLLVLLWLLVGCSGYVDQTKRLRNEFKSGSPEAALASVNQQLGVNDLSQDVGSEVKNWELLSLERATLLQAIEAHTDSAREFQRVDDQLEVADLTKDTLGNIAQFIYSDSAKIYKASPVEKILINALNMINYMVVQQSNGAKIEARRFDINRNYLLEQGEQDASILAFGSYLAGLAFEQADEPNKAIRFYADSLEGQPSPLVERAVIQLHRKTGASDPRLAKLLSSTQSNSTDEGELAIFIQEGLVPRKVAERIPIGLAMTRVSTDPYYRHNMTAKERTQADRLAAKGLVTWVNFPSLKVDDHRAPMVDVAIGSQRMTPTIIANLKAATVEYFQRSQGRIIAAAITRTISRAIAGSATEALGRRSSGGAMGLLLGLAVQGTMTAADTPDTRGWVTLPARIHHARYSLPPGKHNIRVRVGRRTYSKEIDISKNNITVINLSRHREG